MKQQIHTRLIGARVQVNAAETFTSGCGPQSRYRERASQQADVVSVYLKDGSPAYDLLFGDGKIEEGMYAFGFTVVQLAGTRGEGR